MTVATGGKRDEIRVDMGVSTYRNEVLNLTTWRDRTMERWLCGGGDKGAEVVDDRKGEV